MDVFLFAFECVCITTTIVDGSAKANVRTHLGTVWAQTHAEAIGFARGMGASVFGGAEFQVAAVQAENVRARLEPQKQEIAQAPALHLRPPGGPTN